QRRKDSAHETIILGLRDLAACAGGSGDDDGRGADGGAGRRRQVGAEGAECAERYGYCEVGDERAKHGPDRVDSSSTKKIVRELAAKPRSDGNGRALEIRRGPRGQRLRPR